MTAAELREALIQNWAERLSGLVDLLMVEAEQHGRIPRKVWAGYLLSPTRRRLCLELAEHIVDDADRLRAMQQVTTLRAFGAAPLEH